jgi:hypothetical protein
VRCFVDRATGERRWNCEVSAIDTALLMAGVMTARRHFRGTEAAAIAQDVDDRVDWPWMLAGGRTLSMGWKPEGGFLKAWWDRFSELPILYLLGLGSTSHPLPPECWRAWQRAPVVTYAGRTFMQCPPLFVHQYPHAWIDFRHKRDAFADYWQNSVDATLAHRQFCIDVGVAHHLPYSAARAILTAARSRTCSGPNAATSSLPSPPAPPPIGGRRT